MHKCAYHSRVRVTYDPRKAEINRARHGVTFDEAATALLDENALAVEDQDSFGERRWLLVGLSSVGRLLTVCYTLRGETIRLISARKATAREEREYEG